MEETEPEVGALDRRRHPGTGSVSECDHACDFVRVGLERQTQRLRMHEQVPRGAFEAVGQSRRVRDCQCQRSEHPQVLAHGQPQTQIRAAQLLCSDLECAGHRDVRDQEVVAVECRRWQPGASGDLFCVAAEFGRQGPKAS